MLAANGVTTIIQSGGGFTPTPAISHAILTYNRRRSGGQADGIVVTPSHNPPEDGGFKYNPPSGGPADTNVTGWIQDRANALLRAGNSEVKRLPYERAIAADTTVASDLVDPYVRDLANVLDMEAIRSAHVRCGVDPMGGAALAYYQAVAERYKLELTVTNPVIDPRFAFMTLDHDGKIRMDCSSPYAMAKLVELRNQFQVAFGNDADSDRHGIVVPSVGLMNPNHYLAVAIRYLFSHRPQLAGDDRRGQDAGVQRADRPGGRRPGPQAAGGAGRLQVVRRRPAGRHAGLRRRGERRRQLPAPGRHRLDHRQGRHPAGPAGRRDDRHHRQGSRRAPARRSPPPTANRPTPAWTSRRRPRRRPA